MFDLSKIPSEATVHSAELRLYVTELIGSPFKVETWYCPSNEWTELSLTWDNKPYGAAETDVVTVSEIENWYSWDVTSDVKRALLYRETVGDPCYGDGWPGRRIYG